MTVARAKVRQATDFLAKQEYQKANDLVNELLQVYGEPKDTATGVVRIRDCW